MKPFDLIEQWPERVIEETPDPFEVPETDTLELGDADSFEVDQPDLIKVACGWCGTYTPVGPACLTCGSPLNLHRPCGYCGQLRIALCPSCHVSLEVLGSLQKKQ